MAITINDFEIKGKAVYKKTGELVAGPFLSRYTLRLVERNSRPAVTLMDTGRYSSEGDDGAYYLD